MMLQLFAVLALGLMCGSELNVAAFAHPTLNGNHLKHTSWSAPRSLACLAV